MINPQQIRLLRMRSQRLSGAQARPADPSDLLGALLGVQAQDLPAALLSMRARSSGLTAAQIERARLEQRSIAWVWCMRGTLHLVKAEDARWLVALLGPALAVGDRRRMAQLGWDDASAQRGLDILTRALAARGPLARAEIAALLQQHGLPYQGQAPAHLIFRAALEGMLIRGPDGNGEPGYALFDAWLGPSERAEGASSPLIRAQALGRLALGYLQAYAPAAPEDFQRWSGLPRGEVRQAWSQIPGQLAQVALQDGAIHRSLWLLPSQLPWLQEAPPADPQVRLLPRYDTLWMGYANRDLLVNPAFAARIQPGGGIIHPFLLVDGRAQGVWKTTRRKHHLELHIAPFQPLTDAVRAGIQSEVEDIARFLEEDVRFNADKNNMT